MKNVLPKLLVILGPTAVGKSDFAVELAKLYNGEIISADSRQVYKGADELTGKITKKEMRGVPHHLLDVADIKRQYTVTRYKKAADSAIKDILRRGRLPILCGGTGMYINAIVYNQVFPEVKPNAALRKELSKKSTEELTTLLSSIDPYRASTIDTKNARRLVRAIEIAKALGSVPPISYESPVYDALQIGLTLPKEVLDERIKLRLEKRFTKMIGETKNFLALGISEKRLLSLGLEFTYTTLYVTKQISKTDFYEKLYFDIIHYAKRQMVWFKKDTDIHWVGPTEVDKARALITDFIKK